MSAEVIQIAGVEPTATVIEVDGTSVDESEFATCECCGLTEECTPAYIAAVRERCAGWWICGLCAEAVKDEICRSSPRLISAEEATARHMSFCKSFRSSRAQPPKAADGGDHLIAAVRQILRRSLDSPPRPLRSAPSSPRKGGSGRGGGGRKLARSGSCLPTIAG